jgi:hypothetical protein
MLAVIQTLYIVLADQLVRAASTPHKRPGAATLNARSL